MTFPCIVDEYSLLIEDLLEVLIIPLLYFNKNSCFLPTYVNLPRKKSWQHTEVRAVEKHE